MPAGLWLHGTASQTQPAWTHNSLTHSLSLSFSLSLSLSLTHTHTHTHTHGSGRTTYSPFLFGRRARLRESFILLFNLREQTEEVTGRSEVRVGRHRRKTSKLLLPLRGRAPECLGVLGLRTWASYPTLGSRLSRDNFKDEASLWGIKATDPLPSVTGHVAHVGCLQKSTHESDIMALLRGRIQRVQLRLNYKSHSQLKQEVV